VIERDLSSAVVGGNVRVPLLFLVENELLKAGRESLPWKLKFARRKWSVCSPNGS
jgi:hypothetical protein